MIHNTNTGCIFFRYMWGSNNGLGGRCQGITQQLSTDDHNFQPTDASKFLPKLAPTDVNENRTQITSNFCRFHSIFYRFSSTDAHAQKEEDNEQFLPPGGRAISDNPKIIASFTLHISINFFHKQVLISRPHHLQKPFWVWFFKSALYGIGLPRGIYSLFGRKSAHFRNKQLPPFAKRHPVFTLHGKDFALKLDSFPTICNTMLPRFPSTQCGIACCGSFE